MRQKKMMLCFFMMVLTSLNVGVKAKSCTDVLITMSSCLNYVTGSSSVPSSSCCTHLVNVVISSPQCLCKVIGSGGSVMGIRINQTRALAIPGVCHVQTPPISRCTAKPAAIVPSSSPESHVAPTGSTVSPPIQANPVTSNGSRMKLPISFFLLATSLSSLFYAH